MDGLLDHTYTVHDQRMDARHDQEVSHASDFGAFDGDAPVIRNGDNTPLGVIADILETGANDGFIMRREAGSDILIPDIDPVVFKIDLQAREVHVHLLPSLLSDDH